MAITIGDLVSLHRRKKPGIGIVIGHVPDLKNSLFLLFEDQSVGSAALWAAHQRYNKANHSSQSPPEFIHINFAQVNWTERPSEYHQKMKHDNIEWLPTSWLKKIKSSND